MPEVLVSLIISLIIVGVCLWLIDFLPMDGSMKQIVKGLVVLVVVLYLLGLLLGWHNFAPIRFGR